MLEIIAGNVMGRLLDMNELSFKWLYRNYGYHWLFGLLSTVHHNIDKIFDIFNSF
jgi:hypothetical protein